MTWVLVVGDIYNSLLVALYQPNQMFKNQNEHQIKVTFWWWPFVMTSTSCSIDILHMYEPISKTFNYQDSSFVVYIYHGLCTSFFHGDVIANSSSYQMLIMYLILCHYSCIFHEIFFLSSFLHIFLFLGSSVQGSFNLGTMIVNHLIFHMRTYYVDFI